MQKRVLDKQQMEDWKDGRGYKSEGPPALSILLQKKTKFGVTKVLPLISLSLALALSLALIPFPAKIFCLANHEESL